jgi:single-strand DNA-binding protein
MEDEDGGGRETGRVSRGGDFGGRSSGGERRPAAAASGGGGGSRYNDLDDDIPF